VDKGWITRLMDWVSERIQPRVGASGWPKECWVGVSGSQQKRSPQLGHSRMGQFPGPSGGKASTMISSTQSAWSQERQRYLYHSLGPVQGSSVGSGGFGDGWVIRDLLKELELAEDTIAGMIDQLPLQDIAALGADQRVFAEGVLKPLREGLSGQHTVAVGVVRWGGGLGEGGQGLPVPGVTGIGVQAVIADPLEALGQDMLNHAADEAQDRQRFVLDGVGFVVAIPIAHHLAVIAFDPSDADRRGGDVLGQILGDAFAPGRHFAGLQVRDEAAGIVVPAVVEVRLDRFPAQLLGQQGQQMILPFAVHDFVGQGADRFPAALRVDPAGGEQDVQMGVVVSGAAVGLQHDDGSDGQRGPGTGFHDVAQAVVSDLHEAAEQCGVAVEVFPEKLRHGEDLMAVRHVRQQSLADELGPVIGRDLGAGQAKARFAGEGDPAGFPTGAAAVLDIAHFLGVAAREHLLDDFVVLVPGIAGIGLSELVPVVPKDLLERGFVNPFHGTVPLPWYSVGTATHHHSRSRTILPEGSGRQVRSLSNSRWAISGSTTTEVAKRSPRRSRDKFMQR